MTRRLPVLFIVLLSLYPLPLRTDVPSPSRRIVTLELPTGTYRYVDQELLVQPKEGVSIVELNSLFSAYGAYIEDVDKRNRRGYAVVVFPRAIDVLQAEQIVRESPIVKYAHLNYVGTFATTDPYFGQQWALDLPPLNSSTRRVKISGKMRPGRLTHACDAIHGRADNRDTQRS
jgi:hypothetical protein